jgi:hypothetical protein
MLAGYASPCAEVGAMPDDFAERATLGAQEFVRRGAGVVAPPPLAGVPVTLVDGTPLVSRREGAAIYLVLDHRPWPPAAGPAYVEWWTPLRPVEGELAGLFVLTTSHRPAAIGVVPQSCAGLALALTGALAGRRRSHWAS